MIPDWYEVTKEQDLGIIGTVFKGIYIFYYCTSVELFC